MSILIPSDFPNDFSSSLLSGTNPKVQMVEVDGKYYEEGNTPNEQYDIYLMCEDMASQGHTYCLRKIEEGKVADPYAALLRLFAGLQAKDWCASKQKIWIVNRVAAIGNWPMPKL